MQNATVKTRPQYSQNPVNPMPEGNCVNTVDTSGRVQKLFDDLKALGVMLSIAPDGGLSVDGPEKVMADDLLDRVRAVRDDLLALIERFEERAAICEHDGGLSRDEAERLAWSDVIERAERSTVSPEPVEMPEGVSCPWCRGRSFYAAPVGSICARCRRMAWVLLPNGSICRADAMMSKCCG